MTCLYRICFQAAIFKPKYNFFMWCMVCYLQRKVRELQVNRHLYETCREIYSTQLKIGKKRPFCKSAAYSVTCLYRICFQAAIFKPKYNFFMWCMVCYLQRKVRELQVNRHLYETCREIYSTQLKIGKKRPFCKSAAKCIHCYPAYTFCTNEMLSKLCNYTLPVLLFKW